MNIKTIILLILTFLPNISHCTTYYVSQKGNNKQTGTTWESSWRTLQHASNNAKSGDTVIIRKGSAYYSSFTVSHNGEKDHPIVFKGEDRNQPPIISGGKYEDRWQKYNKTIWVIKTTAKPGIIIEDNIPIKKASSSSLLNGNWYWEKDFVYYRPTSGNPDNHEVWRISRGGGISIKNKSWIKISNIECKLGGNSCITISNGHHNTVDNITSQWQWRGVLITNKSTHNTIKNCLVRENRSGIYIMGNSSFNVVDNCRALNNGNAPLYTRSDRTGIAIGEHGEHHHNTIKNSEIAYNGGPNSDAGLIAYKAPYTTLHKNHVHDNYGSGLFVTMNSHHSTITENKVENNGKQAVTSGHKGIVGLTIRHGSSGTIIKNNTIINNHVSSDSRWKGKDLGPKGGLDIRAQRGRDDMANITIQNNTISGTKGGPDIYIDNKIDFEGLIIEPLSQAPWWYRTNNDLK